jgi:glycerate 2-kinase
MHILIAPNAFKNSLSAAAAAEAILLGLRQSRLAFSGECFPVGDGGDGTGDLLMSRLGARITVPASDPLGRERMAVLGIAGDIAVIEMAEASGLRLLGPGERDPLRTSSRGTGDLILAALEKNPRRILLGMGGSATVDGGAGILTALGVRFLDARGKDLALLPAGLVDLAVIDTSGLDPRLKATEIVVLCDVANPLLGPDGAAAVFGPQKGASPKAVQQLETALQCFAQVAKRQFDIDIATVVRGGTAGGAAAGLWALAGATLVSGIDYFLEVTGFDAALERADWVITGEGSIDDQTLRGKGPFGVAKRAKEKGIPVIGLAGRLPFERNAALSRYFDVLLPIHHRAMPLPKALTHTADNLTATARAIGDLLSLAEQRSAGRRPDSTERSEGCDQGGGA